MFFVLSKILDILLTPYTWGLVLLGLAVPWGRRAHRHWKRRRLFGLAGLAVILLFSLEPVSNAMVWRLEREVPSTFKRDVVYDVVVLLGGVTDERTMALTGQPAYNDNVERVVMTHRVLRDGGAKYAIVSGAAMSPSLGAFGEARVLVAQLEDWGIAPERLIVEDRARNTRENAVYSMEIIKARGFTRVLLVTSAYHMKRSVECFRAVGMNDFDTLAVDFRASEGPYDWLPRTGNLHTSAGMFREMFGRWVYRARGYAK